MKCKGIKKNGASCNRNIPKDSKYCHQHIKGRWNKFTYFLANIFGVKRRFLLWMILFGFVIFLIQFNVSYQYTEILNNLKLKPDIEVEISPFLYVAPFGEYLPLIITNTGDYTLKDVQISIHTCEMPEKSYDHYTLPLIPPHSERTIPFGNKAVIKAFKEKECYPFSSGRRDPASLGFDLGKVGEGYNYSSTSKVCGICYFNVKTLAKYTSKDKNMTFNKTVDSYFDFPIDVLLSITKPE